MYLTTKVSNPIFDAALYATGTVINYMVTAGVGTDVLVEVLIRRKEETCYKLHIYVSGTGRPTVIGGGADGKTGHRRATRNTDHRD